MSNYTMKCIEFIKEGNFQKEFNNNNDHLENNNDISFNNNNNDIMGQTRIGVDLYKEYIDSMKNIGNNSEKSEFINNQNNLLIDQNNVYNSNSNLPNAMNSFYNNNIVNQSNSNFQNNNQNNNNNDFNQNNIQQNIQNNQLKNINFINMNNQNYNNVQFLNQNNNHNFLNNQNFNQFLSNNMNIINNNNMNNMQNMINMNNMNVMNNMNNMMNNMNNNNNNMMNNMNIMNNMNVLNNNSNNNLNIIYPHKSGLENLGQTCYMNATIECLSNIKIITDYLLNNYNNLHPEQKPLTSIYTTLLRDLFFSGNNYISPKLFKNIIGELNPLFKGNQAADAKDLVFFLIETLHQENIVKQFNNMFNNFKDFKQLEIESLNENLMFKNFIIDFNMNNKSIISNTFYGINKSIMKCTKCNKIKYSFQAFNMLIFQLKKIKDDKMAKIGVKYNNNTKIDLYDAFLNQQEEESLNGDNQIYCNICQQLNNGIHQQSLYELPYVLIIILNRGKNNQDFNEEFSFPEILDFNNSGIILGPNCRYKRFYLCGIIKHLGESGSSGHFIAYCRNSLNDNFICYNDATFCEVNVNDAMSSKISDKDFEKKTPYILFYHFLE